MDVFYCYEKRGFKKLVQRPGMIPSIFNYCDRWCERCSFTRRCANYAITEQHFSKSDGNVKNEMFWKELHEIFQLTIEMVREDAEKHGIDLDTLDLEKYEDSQKQLDEISLKHECSYLSKIYNSNVDDWFDSAKEFFNEKTEEWELNSRLGMSDFNILQESDNLNDIIEVIRWYQPQIHVKLMRAITGKLEEKQDISDEFLNDSDGSAKVALIGIDPSIAAWEKMLSYFPDKEDETFKILVHLERLRKKTEKEFPNARSFIRPGFDEK